jgi:hypothetical protein
MPASKTPRPKRSVSAGAPRAARRHGFAAGLKAGLWSICRNEAIFEGQPEENKSPSPLDGTKAT